MEEGLQLSQSGLVPAAVGVPSLGRLCAGVLAQVLVRGAGAEEKKKEEEEEGEGGGGGGEETKQKTSAKKASTSQKQMGEEAGEPRQRKRENKKESLLGEEGVWGLPESARHVLQEVLEAHEWAGAEQLRTLVRQSQTSRLLEIPEDEIRDFRAHMRKVGTQINPKYGCDDIEAHLRALFLAQLLELASGVESFDTARLATVGVRPNLLSPPPLLCGLRKLVLRDGCYNISGALLAAARQDLEILCIEGDDFVRDDGSISQLRDSRIRRLILKDMHAGTNEAGVLSALQVLATIPTLRELALDHCDDLPVASIVGFLLKRLSLSSFSFTSSFLPAQVCSGMSNASSLTHVSLRGCTSLNETHLGALIPGFVHIEHLDLSNSSMDGKKLYWFAREVTKRSPEGSVFSILDLSDLKFPLSAVIAVMRCTKTLRKLLLEGTHIELHLADDLAKRKAAKQRAKNKRIGKGQKGGGGAKQPKKKKNGKQDKDKKDAIPVEDGALDKGGNDNNDNSNENNDGDKALKKGKDDMDAGVFDSSVTHLWLSRAKMSDWSAAQIIAHCPDLEFLECVNSTDFQGFGRDDHVSEKMMMHFNRVVSGDNELAFNWKDTENVTVACMTRRRLKHINFFLNEGESTLCTPEFKGAKKPGASLWPELESCFIPNPHKFLLTHVNRFDKLTTLVMSTLEPQTYIKQLTSLERVVYLGLKFCDCDPEFPGFSPLNIMHVPTVLFYKCTLDLSTYCRILGVPRKPDEEGATPATTAVREAFDEPDVKLKRINLYKCYVTKLPSSLDNHVYLTEKQKECLDNGLEAYPEETEAPSLNQMFFRYRNFGSRSLFQLRTCVDWVKHHVVTRRAELVELLGGAPVGGYHPDKTRSMASGLIWELGKELAIQEHMYSPYRGHLWMWW